MVPAELDRTTIVIDIAGSDAQFVATGEVIPFRRIPETLLGIHGRGAGRRGIGHPPQMAQGESVNPANYSHGTLHRTAGPLQRGFARKTARRARHRTSFDLCADHHDDHQPRVRGQTEQGGSETQLRATYADRQQDRRKKALPKPTAREKNRLQPTDIGMVSMTTSNRNSSRSWTTTSRANVERSSTASPTENHLEQHDRRFYGPFHKMVDHATTTQTTKNNQIRILGNDPYRGIR